ncbi:MAG: BatA domain-containing protein [Chloroflexi bacterium]|nr:BatA domain-containing protein [Chloroflexota bacterium]
MAAGALGWLALGLVLYLLHRLRPPLPLIEVPSLHPWRRPPRQGRRRLRDWLRRHLALLLQLLALALLALALASPSVRLPGGGGGIVVTVAQPGLDPAPLAAALEGLEHRRHALVLAQPHPRLALVDGDPEAVLTSLARVPGSHGGGDLSAALDLASGLMAGQDDARGLLLAAGTGEISAGPRWSVLAPAVPDGYRVGPLLSVGGRSGESLLYHLYGRPGSEFELLAETGPNGSADGPGERARIVRSGRMPPSGRLDGLLEDLPADAQIRLWLGGPDSGDHVSAAIGPADQIRGKVLVVGPDPVAYERAARAAGHQVASGPEDEYDIAVYVGEVPEQLPAVGIVLVDPPAGTGILERAEATFDLALADPTGSLLSGVPATALAPGAVRALLAPAAARSHAASGSGSWLWQARVAGREMAVLALNPAAGLSGQAAFPLLVRDLLALVDPMNPLLGSLPARAGVAALLRPHPRADALSILDPEGQVVLATDLSRAEPLAPDSVDPQLAGRGVAWRPQRTGLHWIRQAAEGSTILQTAVWVQAVGPAVAPGAIPEPLGGGTASRVFELWPLLATLAVAALIGEWAWFSRRRGAF